MADESLTSPSSFSPFHSGGSVPVETKSDLIWKRKMKDAKRPRAEIEDLEQPAEASVDGT
jgi:hypothetical protein